MGEECNYFPPEKKCTFVKLEELILQKGNQKIYRQKEIGCENSLSETKQSDNNSTKKE